MFFKDQKNIFIGLLILICILLGLGLGKSCNTDTSKNNLIESYKDSILVLQERNNILEDKQQSLEYDLASSYDKYSSLIKNYKLLKDRMNEKSDSVFTLDDKSTFNFISKWLSKRDSIK